MPLTQKEVICGGSKENTYIITKDNSRLTNRIAQIRGVTTNSPLKKLPTLAELVDAADLKSVSRKRVRVQISKVGP